jgi:hypothetical protein
VHRLRDCSCIWIWSYLQEGIVQLINSLL